MFSVNDSVMYEGYGVCKIIDIKPEIFDKRKITYYILKPLYDDKTTMHCPVEGAEKKLRRLLTSEEIHSLIKLMPDAKTSWVDNDQLRKEKFLAIIKEGKSEELVRLIKTLYLKRQEKLESGKKFHVSDERFMKEAENILYGEFAHVLSISPEEVVPFIFEKHDK
ncbi:MAG: CarD family transcriptional regulator [Clostridia bacterium]|nr:CarD family transcriptional regulator [Clostridia bacterium]